MCWCAVKKLLTHFHHDHKIPNSLSDMRSFSMAFCSEINARCSFTLFLILLHIAQYEMPPDTILRPLGLYVWCYSIVSRKNYRLYITANKMKRAQQQLRWATVATIDIGRKEGGCALFSGRAGSPSKTVAWAEDYRHTKWHLSPSSCLATKDIGRKLEGCVPLWDGELGAHLTQCGQGRGLPARQVSSWSIQPFGHNTPTSQTDRTGQDRQTRVS